MTENTPAPTLPAASVPAQATPVVCASCGAVAASDPPPLTWSAGIERGRKLWTCEGCMRDHLRSIEGKLDSPWW